MSLLYLDASSIVTIFVEEPETQTIVDIVTACDTPPIVSDFAAGEVASAISRRLRERSFTETEARALLGQFDRWCRYATRVVEITSEDVSRAIALVRRFDLKLRMPDALHLAVAESRSAQLLTRDGLMGDAARLLGIDVYTAA